MMVLYLASVLFLLTAGVEAEPRNCTTASGSCFEIGGIPEQPCLLFRESLTCLKDTRDVCPLNETRVTFDQLVPLAVETCEALVPVLVNINCSASATCVSRTETAKMVNLTNPDLDFEKQRQLVLRSIITTTFWCRYMEEYIGCYVSSADSCSIPGDNVKIVQSHLDKVRATCNTSGVEAEPRNCTTASGSCFEIGGIPEQPCLLFRESLTCLRDTKDVCPLNETRVTFDQLVPLAVETCEALVPVLVNINCSASGTCVSRTETAKMVNLTNPDLDLEKQRQLVLRSIITTTFWCRFMEEYIGCYVSSAESCSIPGDKVKIVQSHLDKVRATCNTSETVTVGLLVYVAALVLHWTRH